MARTASTLRSVLRDARAAGSAGAGDEWHAALDDLTVDQLRIAQLERLVACAVVVDDATARDGGARLGALVARPGPDR